ncbi:MAG: NEW3 domain-containing protein, partial [Anaerolineae bacterium]
MSELSTDRTRLNSPDPIQVPFLRLLGLTLSVTLLALLAALVLGRATNTAHAGPLSVQLPRFSPQQEGCYEPGNLAPNPGFECEGATPAEPADWEPDTYKGKPAVFYRSQLAPHAGDYAVAIASGTEPSESRWQSILISARKDWVYEFSAWVNADNLSDRATVALSFWSDVPSPTTHLRTVTHIGTGNTAGEWVHLAESYRAPTGTRYIRLECHLLGAGTAYFDDVAIREYAQEPVLDLVQIDVPDPVRPGDSLSYTLTLSNTGNVTATNVVISNTFDLNVTFAGDAIPATVDAPLPDQTVLYNRVQWRSDQTGPDEQIETTVVRNTPILSIVKTDQPDPVMAGERLTYTIAYTNSGTAPMTDILILETYPTQTLFLSASPPPINPPVNTRWTMPDLLPGQSDVVTVVLSTSSLASGEIINTVLFDSNEFDHLYVTETTTISGTKPPYRMRFSPEETEIRVQVDQPGTGSYDLKNTGSQTLTNILVDAGRPASWQGGIRVEPTHVPWLAPGELVSVSLHVEPAASEISSTYSVPITASDTEASAYARARVVVGRHTKVQIEPDYKHHARRSEQVVPVHEVTNLGNFTDT